VRLAAYGQWLIGCGQRIVVGLLFLSLMLQCFSKMLVVADFYAHRDYIARNLCINRLRTAVHCGGRCQLDKRILEENNSSGDTEHKLDSRFEVLSSRCFYLTGIALCSSRIVTCYSLLPVDSPVDQPATIFHPPAWLGVLSHSA